MPKVETTVEIAPAQNVGRLQNDGMISAELVYTREIEIPDEDAGMASKGEVQETLRFALPENLRGECVASDAVGGTEMRLRFLRANGAVSVERKLTASQGTKQVTLTQGEVDGILAPTPAPAEVPVARRDARLVPVSTLPVAFAGSQLFVAPVIDLAATWQSVGLAKLTGLTRPQTASVEVLDGAVATAGLPWMSVPLASDGAFSWALSGPQGKKGWLWWLVGGRSALGLVVDDLTVQQPRRMAIPLPAFTAPTNGTNGHGAHGRTVPLATSERELAENAEIYTEDAGAYCRPFSNPERVVGERSMYTIFRAEQPEVGARPSIKTAPPALLDFDPELFQAAPTRLAKTTSRTVAGRTAPAGAVSHAATSIDFSNFSKISSRLVPSTLPLGFTRIFDTAPRGRTHLDGEHPLEWESEIARYQATTPARGHILEFRIRWRSNGYSLGNVIKTLTLAPRQARRIQKVEWERMERAKRVERTELTDQVSDETERERTYEDEVRASLSEWARGESRSSTTAAAGGAGFAMMGFVVGGGGAHSSAKSSSEQEGGRRTAASEEQRLRDSIRRHGESIRRLETMVVTEVRQEETVTGTTEMVGNPNYAHSLTIIYHEILRHLRIETAIAGIRECVFVPFAVKPFTLARAYRWRAAIQKHLRDRRHSLGLTYLKDVMTNFADSSVPEGRRSDQPIRSLHGSVYVSLAVARPADGPEGVFLPAAWSPIQRLLGAPAPGIYARLQQAIEAARDRVFQDEHAPGIAARWANLLKLEAAGRTLKADFTLASRYVFNGVVRVDFTIALDSDDITRESLSSIRIRAGASLPPGSVANVTGMSYTYETDHFRRSVSLSQGVNDLITVDTGEPESTGALLTSSPTSWERQDLRQQMLRATRDLVDHLNEHVEHYHKAIWWSMDRDRLYMMLDGFYAPGTKAMSIASVVERDPIAVVGNCLVFRVSAGSFLGFGTLDTPEKLHNYYVEHQIPRDPVHVALPTDGLYAQSIMDECGAVEEHFGNTDWVLSDRGPDLPVLDSGLLASRRTEPANMQPSPLPATIINLQNAPDAPAPSGLAAALNAVTNPNAFRDMAGLAGTQALAQAGLQTAAGLAQSFGAQAAALKLADMAAKAQAAQLADQKLASIQRAVEKQVIEPADGRAHGNRVLNDMHVSPAEPVTTDDVTSLMRAASEEGVSLKYARAEGDALSLEVSQASWPMGVGPSACGFFTPGGVAVSEADVRDEVVQAARNEVAHWRDAAGHLVRESDDDKFGHLVRYWLGRFRNIPPSTLLAAEANAAAAPPTAYGHLLDNATPGVTSTNAQTAAAALATDNALVAPSIPAARTAVLAGVPAPATALVATDVGQALSGARHSKIDARPGPWSAVFVSTCVRHAAITLGLETDATGAHQGQDALLKATQRHNEYVLAAYQKRFGPGAAEGTYHAFRPSERVIQTGDIIVMDRTEDISANQVWSFDRINGNPATNTPNIRDAGRKLHGDIVVEVNANDVVTIGGNVGNTVGRRRYPLNSTGHLDVQATRRFVGETPQGDLPNLPAALASAPAILSGNNARRIFAVLSPVERCDVAAAPSPATNTA